MRIQLIKYVGGKKVPKKRWNEDGTFSLRFISDDGSETYEKLNTGTLKEAQQVLEERKASAVFDTDAQIALLEAQLRALRKKKQEKFTITLPEVWEMYLKRLRHRRPKEVTLKSSKTMWDGFCRFMKTSRIDLVTRQKVKAIAGIFNVNVHARTADVGNFGNVQQHCISD